MRETACRGCFRRLQQHLHQLNADEGRPAAWSEEIPSGWHLDPAEKPSGWTGCAPGSTAVEACRSSSRRLRMVATPRFSTSAIWSAVPCLEASSLAPTMTRERTAPSFAGAAIVVSVQCGKTVPGRPLAVEQNREFRGCRFSRRPPRNLVFPVLRCNSFLYVLLRFANALLQSPQSEVGLFLVNQ